MRYSLDYLKRTIPKMLIMSKTSLLIVITMMHKMLTHPNIPVTIAWTNSKQAVMVKWAKT